MQKNRRQDLRRSLKYAAFPGLLVIGSLLAASYIAAQMYLPVALSKLIDDVLTKRESASLEITVLILALTAVAMSLFNGGQRLVFALLGERALVKLREAILVHMHRLPISFFDQERSGKVNALFTIDAPAMAKLYFPIIGDTVLSILQVIAIITLVSVRYGTVIFIAGLLIPMYVLFPIFISRRTREGSKGVQEANAELASSMQESIEATREIKAFTREDWNIRRMSNRFMDVLRHQMRFTRINSLYFLNGAAYWVIVSIVYWYGGRRVLADQMTVGELIALVFYLGFLDVPTNRLVAINAQVQAALGAASRVFDFLDLPAEDDETTELRTLAHGQHTIEFNSVSFTYGEDERPALEGVSFRVEPGQRVAIVGPSGAGKSTLMSLLLGFYKPQQGSVCLNREEISRYKSSSLRHQVCMVFQEPFLLASSVRDNIRFGRLEATDDEIEEAARVANAHDFIIKLPQGYDAEVGERGTKLSVGQKQRIAIARAVIRNPSILILDEATSALDTESEHLVREALKRVMVGRTCFIIAHRISTIINSDLILVIDGGRVVATGRHSELIESSPVYERLYNLQFQDEGAEVLQESGAA